ncbi:MAG: hypothetical protein EAZ06_02700 [Cytophagales bacterium]|nr:MAG: hypothetical protein EAZ06_02700 [Cytophagales bacterium]
MSYLQNTTEEALSMQKNLLDLLATNEQVNIELALQLIDGGGMVAIFVLPLWINYYEAEKKIQTKIKKNITKILPEHITKTIFASNLYDLYDISATNLVSIFEELCDKNNRLFTWDDIVEWVFPKLIDRMDICDYFIKKENINTKKILQKMIVDDKISLDYSTLTILPKELFLLDSLESITIDNSAIEEMPPEFFEMKSLKSFSYNKTALKKNRTFNHLLKKKIPLLVATNLYKEAKDNYWGNRYKLSSKKIQKCVKIYPHSALFWHWYGEIHRITDDHGLSEIGFLKSLAIEKDNAFATIKLAEVACHFRKCEEALQICDDYLNNIQNYSKEKQDMQSDAWFIKGLAYFWLKDYQKSLVCNDKSIKLSNYAGAWYNKACAYSKLNLKTEMLNHLKKSFDLDYEDYYPLASKDEDKDFDTFYDDEDFKTLLKQYK